MEPGAARGATFSSPHQLLALHPPRGVLQHRVGHLRGVQLPNLPGERVTWSHSMKGAKVPKSQNVIGALSHRQPVKSVVIISVDDQSWQVKKKKSF